jgi:alpha-1,3-rhamnosyl/mannosyltransferase
VSELVPALLSAGDRLEIVALGGRREQLPSGVAYVREPWHPPTNLGWAAVGLPRAAARAGVDLIHAPAYTAPLRAGVPVVLTIHDVSYERHPEWYPYRRDWLRRAFYRHSARTAAHVLTDSEFSRGEIVAAYGLPTDRITVAPLGVTASFAPGESLASLPAGVTPPFLLHVGDLHERRNLPLVVEALLDIRRRRTTGAPSLVLAGVDRGVGRRLSSMALEAGDSAAVVRLGPVTESVLRSLYAHASGLVYPSRYEGFGLPLLEAMASGTPVLASRAASIPEIIGDAGLLLDPDDGQAWRGAIDSFVGDAALRVRLRDAGLARVRQFTWARTAGITLEVYRSVTKDRGAMSARPPLVVA